VAREIGKGAGIWWAGSWPGLIFDMISQYYQLQQCEDLFLFTSLCLLFPEETRGVESYVDGDDDQAQENLAWPGEAGRVNQGQNKVIDKPVCV
jgi:hypothetical protein